MTNFVPNSDKRLASNNWFPTEDLPYFSLVESDSCSRSKASFAVPRTTLYAWSPIFVKESAVADRNLLLLSKLSSSSLRFLNLSSLTLGIRLSLLDGSNGLNAPPKNAGSSPSIRPCFT